MRIAGLQRVSLIDYPDRIAATIFIAGCNLDCGYCHNRWMLREAETPEAISASDLVAWLRTRVDLLDGVCLTGGEPTLHEEIAELTRTIKRLGFAVKLDTNGTNPRMLQSLMAERTIDFVAMDIKAPMERYAATVRAQVAADDLLLSIEVILGSGLAHEFRTTFVDSLLSAEDVLETAKLVRGCQRHVLQPFRVGKVLEGGFGNGGAPDRTCLAAIARIAAHAGFAVVIR
jgi:pyruvate formate lyase activating enzyme